MSHPTSAKVFLSYRRAEPDQSIVIELQAQLEAAEDPDALRAEIEARLARGQNPFRTAEAFLVDDIVDPRETRPRLCEFAELAAPLRTPGPTRHGLRP